jgi:alkylation response protein AidB-like acyl-CoA dehydrogenase
MDFSLTDEQQAAVALADQIFTDRCTIERQKEIAAGSDGWDRELWAELARADLLGLSLPEAVGGGGYGFLETCLVLEQVGAHVAPVPLWATLVLGALPIAEYGTDDQRAVLAGVAAGETVLTGALEEEGAGPRDPFTTAAVVDGGFRLDGTKILVPVASDSATMVVSARLASGEPALFLVAPGADGVTITAEDAMGQWPVSRVELDGVVVGPDARLPAPDGGRAQLDWLVDRAQAALCAMAAGVTERALRLTAAYATERKQFDRPIGSFQAVGQRLADAYIDAEAVRLTMLNAVSLLDAGEPADTEVATAKFWAADGASRVVHAALHVHGGISIDVDYPVHRYFLWAKQIEVTLGAATPELVRLGALLAAGPA